MKSATVKYQFDGWIIIELPETWIYEQEDDILNIYSNVNPKGATQISFIKLKLDMTKEDIANDSLNNFIPQFSISVEINTRMILERDDYTIATATGLRDGRFIKTWCLVENERALLITYNSPKKTREVSIVDDIVYGIRFI